VTLGVRRGCAVHIRFAGAHPTPRVESADETPGRFHFFRGSDPSAWRTGARRFTDVAYRDVWPGIDLIFRVAPGAVTYEAVLHPGADPSQIRLEIEGAVRVIAESGGVQRIETSAGTLMHQAPAAGERNGRIACGEENADDPPRLRSMSTDWITFLGGSVWDGCFASASDALGRPVVVGAADSPDFPATPGAYQDSLAGEFDAIVAKLSAAGDSLLWATYLGGELIEQATDVILDATGNIVTTGETYSPDFPTTAGAFDTTASPPSDDRDCFVTKLSPTGDSLLWSTYLGGGQEDLARSLALDTQENVVVAGLTESLLFPTTAGAYDEVHNGDLDMFVTKVTATGNALVWSTFIGTEEQDLAWQVALDAQYRPIVVGRTLSPDFPTTAGAFQETYQGGDYDGTVSVFAEDASVLLFSTFLGGDDQDWTTGVAVTAAGNLAVGVRTNSENFPTTAGAYDTTPNGGIDFAVLELDSTASTLHWSTLVGGSSHEWCANLEIGAEGALVTAGTTNSDDFPTTADAYDTTYNGHGDGFVTIVSANGASLLHGSYYGGSDDPPAGYKEGFEFANPVSVTPNGDVFLAGISWSSDFPTTEGAWDRTFDGGADGVLVGIKGQSPVPVLLSGFTAEPRDRAVHLSWFTSFEYLHDGFNLYRSGLLESGYARLNSHLIRGRSPYFYLDKAVRPATTYFYKLGAVDTWGTRCCTTRRR
jgi:hypothetical protein